MMASLVIMSSLSYCQCELPIPEGSNHLCAQQQLSISNTTNSITIADPNAIPSSFASSYTVTVSYYEQRRNACAPQIVCPNATLSATGSSINITVSI